MEKAYTHDEFDSLIENVDIRVKDYVKLAGYEKWARLYAYANRGRTMTLNIAKSINSALVSTRELPIYDFLEEVSKMLGHWNCNNRKEASHTYTTLGKKYQEVLTLNEALSIHMTVEMSNSVNGGENNILVDHGENGVAVPSVGVPSQNHGDAPEQVLVDAVSRDA
ncbi:uncharacterized protein [Nicotiana sylvestris]|uniref:uncharacterized protein n=1 Tax=Nicotiana sylvestris TaxID=4096 RepID=UPI00388CE9EC